MNAQSGQIWEANMAPEQSLEKQLIQQRLLVQSLEKSLEFARADLATLTAATAPPKPQPDKSLQRELTCVGCREPIAVGEPVAFVQISQSLAGPGVAAYKTKQPLHIVDSCLQSVSEQRPSGLIAEIKQSLLNPVFRDPSHCKNCDRVLVVERRGKPNSYCGHRCKQQFENRSRKAG